MNTKKAPLTDLERDNIRNSLTYSLPVGIKDFEWEIIINNVEMLIAQAQSDLTKRFRELINKWKNEDKPTETDLVLENILKELSQF